VNLWTIMSPHARLVFDHPDGNVLHQFYTELALIPGCKLMKRASGWEIPRNAVGVVNDLANRVGVSVVDGGWLVAPRRDATWAEVDAKLREGGVAPWVLDSFATQYQKDAVLFGWNKTGVNFWHTTGAGKTLTAILSSLESTGPVVVVTRAVSRIQFGREIKRFLGVEPLVVRPESDSGGVKVRGETWHMFRKRHKGKGLKTAKLAQMWEERKAKFGPDRAPTISEYVKACRTTRTRPYIVLGWEAIPLRLDELKAIGPGCLIADEAHKVKSTKRFSVVHLHDLSDNPAEAMKEAKEQEEGVRRQKGFIKVTEDGRKAFIPVESVATAAAELSRAVRKRIATTATPVKDRVRDLWGQLDLIEPNSFGSSTNFRLRYCNMHPGTYGGMDDRGRSNEDELNARLVSFTHKLAYEQTHKHLPPKRRVPMYIAPEDQVAELGGFGKELKDAQKFGASALLEVRLAIAASRKRKAVLGIIEDHINAGQKVCVFTSRRRDVDELGKLCYQKFGKVATVWASHGGQTPGARQAVVDDYMAHPGPCVLIGTGDAFGESLNLDTTDAALFVMLPYTPGQLRQWEGRFHRVSTTRSVIIYYIIAEGTADERVADILINKLPAVEKIAGDRELAEARGPLSGVGQLSEEDFVASILDAIDNDSPNKASDDDEEA